MNPKTALPMSTAVAILPGGFNAVVFALAVPRHSTEIALLGVVAAHTSLRALWGGIHSGGWSRAPLDVFDKTYHLNRDLAIVAKGFYEKAEWQLMAQPGVVPADEHSVRVYAGRSWPLPPDPMLPVLDAWALDMLIGEGDYLAAPPLESSVWPTLIRRAVIGDEDVEEVY